MTKEKKEKNTFTRARLERDDAGSSHREEKQKKEKKNR